MKHLIIEPLLADEALQGLVTEEEQRQAVCFAAARRREYLSWRAVVRRELGPDTQIGYDADGAPRLENRDFHISVSHGAGRVAVCISDRPCGVDIESEARDFSRVASRYLSPSEAALCNDPLLPAVVWCGKEALYKLARKPGLDFLRDLHILHVDLAAGTLTGQIENGEPVRLSVHRGEGILAVYTL